MAHRDVHRLTAVPDPAPDVDEHTLVGRIADLSGHSWVSGIEVALVATTVDGDKVGSTAVTDDQGCFVLELPLERLWRAAVICDVPGTSPVDLDLDRNVLEPGEVVIVVNEPGPFHVRYGLA